MLFGKYSGTEIKIDGEEFLIMREEEVLGIYSDREPLEPNPTQAGRCHRGLHSQPEHALAATPRTTDPGTIGWHELYTTDLEAGFDFYNKLFGWTKVSDMDMGPMGVYRIFDEGDHKEMGDGGMMTKAPQIPISCWNFYFNVDSINAAVKRVESGGGKIMNGPMQVPGGGWIINGQDPQGAMFSLVSNME